jgi:hypothetical protein
VRDNIGVLIRPDGPFEYFAHHDMNFPDAARRSEFLQQVERAFGAW